MKIQLTPTLLFRNLICLLLSIFVFSDPAFAQKTVSKPGKKEHYISASFNGPGWTLLRNTYYTYDPNGLPIEILRTDSLNSFQDRKTIYYDAFGNDTLTITSVMRNGSIHDYFHRNKLTYDSNQKLIEKLWQALDSVGNWEDVDKTTYAYVNGQVNEITFTRFDAPTATWLNIYKQKNISWHLPTKQMDSYIQQVYQNNTWTDQYKFSATFDSFGGSVGFLQYWMNNTWMNGDKITITHDSLGNEINYLKEYWDNGNWSFYSRDVQPIVYDSNGNILEQYSSKTCISCTPASDEKYVYSNYQTFMIAGLKNQIPQEISVSIYPNPTQNLINIDLPENTQAVAAQLTDLTGKAILKQHFKASEQKQLNLENLKPGIYLLSLETEKGKTVRKILKN